MAAKAAPREIQESFEQLKLATGKRLSLHAISGQYYVYEYSSSTDARSRKTVVKTYYLGHIMKDGRFVAKGEKKLALLEVKDKEDGGKETGYDEREAIALRNLSMNGRMSMKKLAGRLGMSVTGTRNFVKRLEKKYGIRYFAEVNTLKLGYLRYIALVKFEDKIPTMKEVKDAFEDDPHVALVAMTKGIYDMIVIFYLESGANIANFVYQWRAGNALPDYTAKWYITPLDMASGITIPLRKCLVEFIATGVSKEDSTTFGVRLSKIEAIVFKEMAIDAAQEFRYVDKNYRLSSGRSNYAFYKLREKGILERTTITIDLPNLKYNSVFITETNNYKKFTEHQDLWRMDLIRNENPLVNNNAFRGDIGAPDSILHIRPIFEETGFHRMKDILDSLPGTRTESMVITDLVVGSLCYRNFDPRYTTVYDVLLKHRKVSESDKVSY